MASGDLLMQWESRQFLLPTTSSMSRAVNNLHWFVAGDAATDERFRVTGVMPTNYSGGGVTLEILWRAATATSGAARNTAAFENLASQDLDIEGFATAQSAGGTANGTLGVMTTTTITFTNGAQMDSVTAGDPFRIQIYRDADGTTGTDDMSGDQWVYQVSLYET